MRHGSLSRVEMLGERNLLGIRIPLIAQRFALAVAHYRSFRQAALALGVSQSSVSERIRALEEDLGVVLFDRNTRDVRPTEAGCAFVAEVDQAMQILDRAVKTVGRRARGEEGRLHIGVYALIAGGFLDRLLESFHRHYPQIALRITEGTARDAEVLVRDGVLDAAFIIHTYDIPDLNSRVVWRDRVMAAIPETHPLATQQEVEWNDLACETLVVRETGTGPQVHDLIVVRSAGRWPVPIILNLDIGRGALMAMIAKGYGISLLAEETMAVAPPGIAFRPVADEADYITFTVIWSPRNRGPALGNLLNLSGKLAQSDPDA